MQNQTKKSDASLKNMGRKELVELLYNMRVYEESLENELKETKARLEGKTIQLSEAGNIAEAALGLNHIFEAAQAAADQYLLSVKNIDIDRDEILARAHEEAETIKEDARREIEVLEEARNALQKELDEQKEKLLEEARKEVAEERRNMLEEVELEKKTLLSQAEEEAQTIIADARSQAEEILKVTRNYCVEQLTKLKERTRE